MLKIFFILYVRDTIKFYYFYLSKKICIFINFYHFLYFIKYFICFKLKLYIFIIFYIICYIISLYFCYIINVMYTYINIRIIKELSLLDQTLYISNLISFPFKLSTILFTELLKFKLKHCISY